MSAETLKRRTRAALLAALAAACLLAAGCGGSGDDDGSVERGGTTTNAAPIESRELTVDSEAVGEELQIGVLEAPGTAAERRPPLLVFLHGAGGSHESFLEDPALEAALLALGRRAPLLVFPEGEDSWWHDRESGSWARYVLEEAIPAAVARLGADPRRVAIGGISMGGYGAYHLGLEDPGRFCAVGGHSAGLWSDPREEFPGAFDDRADYQHNDVLAAVRADPDAFGAVPIWNDHGDRDWFVAGNAAFVAALEESTVTPLAAHVWPGGHDAAYWSAHWPDYLRFYADALTTC